MSKFRPKTNIFSSLLFLSPFGRHFRQAMVTFVIFINKNVSTQQIVSLRFCPGPEDERILILAPPLLELTSNHRKCLVPYLIFSLR